MNEEAAKQLLEDHEQFSKTARLMTSIHAKPEQPTLSTQSAVLQNKENLSGKTIQPQPQQQQAPRPAAGPAKTRSLKRL